MSGDHPPQVASMCCPWCKYNQALPPMSEVPVSSVCICKDTKDPCLPPAAKGAAPARYDLLLARCFHRALAGRPLHPTCVFAGTPTDIPGTFSTHSLYWKISHIDG